MKEPLASVEKVGAAPFPRLKALKTPSPLLNVLVIVLASLLLDRVVYVSKFKHC